MSETPPNIEVIERTADLLHQAFWWHESYRGFYEAQGVPPDLIDTAYEQGSHKGRVCRSIMKHLLHKGTKGVLVAWQIIDAARALTGPIHAEAGSQAGFDQLHAKLEAALVGRVTRIDASVEESHIQSEAQCRSVELQAIHDCFCELMSDQAGDPAKRGYALEEIVARLCRCHSIDYDPPQRLPGQQIDGAIRFGGRHIVLETRWRKDRADFGDILKLSGKARARLVGTLGLFLSMEGFSEEGVRLWLESGNQRNCILLQGAEFLKIVKGYVSWPDALQQMIDQAAVRGDVLAKLSI